MLSSSNPSNAVIKLIDFGCSVIIEDDDLYGSDGNISLAGRTLAYCPPEMLDSSKRPENLDPSVDMWAIGVILYSEFNLVYAGRLSWQVSFECVKCTLALLTSLLLLSFSISHADWYTPFRLVWTGIR